MRLMCFVRVWAPFTRTSLGGSYLRGNICATTMGKKVLGVELAPAHVPLERRKQTLSALFAMLMFVFGGFAATILMIKLLFTSYFWITLLYGVWYIYDWNSSSRGGHRIESVRHLRYNEYLRDYFPITLTKTADLDPKQNYIFGYHPHGIMSIGAYNNFATEATGFSEKFPGITPYFLTLKLLHQLPLYREYLSMTGICDVSKESIQYILRQEKKGKAVVIVIGGAKEAMDANPGETHIVLKNRKGFVKIAIREGTQLVPVFSFGENDIYKMALENDPGSKVRKFQRWFQHVVGFAPVLFSGRGIFNYTFGLVPYRHPVNTVVGKPIPVERVAEPSQEQIDALHGRYMQELEKLFEAHKDHYGYGDTKLHFVE